VSIGDHVSLIWPESRRRGRPTAWRGSAHAHCHQHAEQQVFELLHATACSSAHVLADKISKRLDIHQLAVVSMLMRKDPYYTHPLAALQADISM
jgi:hypothetical protein